MPQYYKFMYITTTALLRRANIKNSYVLCSIMDDARTTLRANFEVLFARTVRLHWPCQLKVSNEEDQLQLVNDNYNLNVLNVL